MDGAPVLEFRGISKRFPGVLALDDVSLSILPGEVHAIVGENGAGKSTLMKIAAGVYQADDGQLLLRGAVERLAGPTEALRLGIAMVPQELNLVPRMKVAENVLLGMEPLTPRRLMNKRELHRRAREILGTLGVEIDTHRELAGLSVAQQQLVQIARAMAYQATVLIMDEPTASLSQRETDHLFDRIRSFREAGTTVLYISHRLEEVLEIADRVTVLRDGRLMSTMDRSAVTEDEIIRLMIGRSLDEFLQTRNKPDIEGEPVLEVRHLTVRGQFRDVSFKLRPGEILGFAGLVGAGRTEVAAAILGLSPVDAGDVLRDGRVVRIKSPKDALDLGIGCVPEERKRQGLFLNLDVMQNVSMPFLARLRRRLAIDGGRERREVGALVERLRVQTPSLDHPVAGLSGGNQQKVIVARWLGAGVEILILDEPTRGIDVNAKAEIHALIGELASRGKAVVLISSELDELLALSDTIVVMHEGEMVGQLAGRDASKAAILRLAMWGATPSGSSVALAIDASASGVGSGPPPGGPPQ